MNSVFGAHGSPEERAVNFSWLALGFSVSNSIGPLVAGYAIDGLGHASAFLVLAFFPVLAVGLLWRRKTALPATMLVIGFVASGGCTYQNNTSAEPALRQYWPHPEQVSFKHSTPDFHMVHCQLPPTIHRLGLELAYLGPTRKVRTSIRDCVIRGGNFVVFDGADRAT